MVFTVVLVAEREENQIREASSPECQEGSWARSAQRHMGRFQIILKATQSGLFSVPAPRANVRSKNWMDTQRRDEESRGRVGSTDYRESLKQTQEAERAQEKNEADALSSERLRDLPQVTQQSTPQLRTLGFLVAPAIPSLQCLCDLWLPAARGGVEGWWW